MTNDNVPRINLEPNTKSLADGTNTLQPGRLPSISLTSSAQDEQVKKRASYFQKYQSRVQPNLIARIFFEFDKNKLESFERAVLAGLVDHYWSYIEEGRGLHLRIIGHTDKRGNERYNLRLGDRRARVVLQCLNSLFQAKVKTGDIWERFPTLYSSKMDSKGESEASGIHDWDRRVDVFSRKPVKKEPCWYNWQELVRLFRLYCEAASRYTDRNYERLHQFESVTFAFHCALKVLEHWDTYWRDEIYSIKLGENQNSLPELARKHPNLWFRYFYDFAEDQRKRGGKMLQRASGAGIEHREAAPNGFGHTFEYQLYYPMSQRGKKVLKETYLHIEEYAKKNAETSGRKDNFEGIKAWKSRLAQKEAFFPTSKNIPLPYGVEF